jgi:hypothetical protein
VDLFWIFDSLEDFMIASLFKSRKFLLMLLDIIISTATFFITKYLAPEVAEDILWLIGAWQPVIIALILAIAQEDSAVKSNPLYFSEPNEPQG